MRRTPWALLAAIALWVVASVFKLADPLYVPSPLAVVTDLYHFVASGELPVHIAATIYRLIVGFALGAAIGLPLGLLMGYSRRIYNSFEAFIELLRSIPVVAMFPLFMIVFGLGNSSKFAVTAWSTSFILLINTMYGVRHANPTRRLVGRSLRATNAQLFRLIILPDALPNVLVGLRTAASIGLIVVLMSEMFLGTHAGLGQAVYNAHLMYDTPRMYATILVSGALGYVVNLLLLLAERRFLHWKESHDL